MSLENLCTSQLLSHVRVICISCAVCFKAICTSPRPNKTTVALTLLVLETVRSVERDSHKSPGKRNNLDPGQNQAISLCTCWCSSDAGKGSLSLWFWFTTNSHPSSIDSIVWAEWKEVADLETRFKFPQLFVFLGAPWPPAHHQ